MPAHGVMIAVHEDWADMIHSWEIDYRGWGRYLALKLVGGSVNKQKAETFVVVCCYSPSANSKQYKVQKTLLVDSCKDVGSEDIFNEAECNVCPWHVMRTDLGSMVKKYEKQKAMVVMMGDFNFTWDVRSRSPNSRFEGESKERSKIWKTWTTEYMKYVNFCSECYTDIMKNPAPTF